MNEPNQQQLSQNPWLGQVWLMKSDLNQSYQFQPLVGNHTGVYLFLIGLVITLHEPD